MISTYLSLGICLAICVKLMFFMDTPRVYAPQIYNVGALIVTIYAGSRSISHLATLNQPTSPSELIFNLVLLGCVFYLSFVMHHKIKSNWRRH